MLTLIERGESVPIPKGMDVSNQWYHYNPQRLKAEIEAMARVSPDSRMGYLPNGRMAWLITLSNSCAPRKWIVLAVYDDAYPNRHMGWGGGVRFYPVNPNYQEMLKLVNDSPVEPKCIPHIFRDELGIVLSIEVPPIRDNNLVDTAASCIQYVRKWIMYFELGLSDRTVWEKFHWCSPRM